MSNLHLGDTIKCHAPRRLKRPQKGNSAAGPGRKFQLEYSGAVNHSIARTMRMKARLPAPGQLLRFTSLSRQGMVSIRTSPPMVLTLLLPNLYTKTSGFNLKSNIRSKPISGKCIKEALQRSHHLALLPLTPLLPETPSANGID